MRTPFPYFGGKGRIAAEVWQRFGDPSYYFEPFGGALAVLLGRPTPGKYRICWRYLLLNHEFFSGGKVRRLSGFGPSSRLADFST